MNKIIYKLCFAGGKMKKKCRFDYFNNPWNFVFGCNEIKLAAKPKKLICS